MFTHLHADWTHVKRNALGDLHERLTEAAGEFIGRTRFEVAVDAPIELAPDELYRYTTLWTDQGWHSSVIPTKYELGIQYYAIQLRGYVDALPY